MILPCDSETASVYDGGDQKQGGSERAAQRGGRRKGRGGMMFPVELRRPDCDSRLLRRRGEERFPCPACGRRRSTSGGRPGSCVIFSVVFHSGREGEDGRVNESRAYLPRNRTKLLPKGPVSDSVSLPLIPGEGMRTAGISVLISREFSERPRRRDSMPSDGGFSRAPFPETPGFLRPRGDCPGHLSETSGSTKPDADEAGVVNCLESIIEYRAGEPLERVSWKSIDPALPLGRR
jgi:hypothetical protein